MTWAERRQRRIAIRELRALDDRTLKDMGLTRGEIFAIVHGAADGGEPVQRCTPAAAAREEIDAATLQRHLARARQLRAEFVAGVVRRSLARLRRRLRRAGTASGAIGETTP
jgi:hypothetical protein